MRAIGIGCRGVTSALGIAILVAFLAATHSAAAATSGCEARAIRAHQTLLANRLDNWEPLDDHMVLVWTMHSVRAHLLKMETPILGLADADVIHLVDGDHDRLISACGRDGIAVVDDAGVWQVARIASIELLSKRRTAELESGVRAPASAESLRA